MTDKPLRTPPPPTYAAANMLPPDASSHTPGLTTANLVFLASPFLAIVVSVVEALIFPKSENEVRSTLLTELVGVILVPLVVAAFNNYDIRATFSLNPLAWRLVWRAALLGIFGQFAVLFVANLNQWLFDSFGPFPNLVILPTSFLPALGFLLLVAFLPAVCEETLNRGMVLAGYRKLGFWRAVMLVGVLFGIFHIYPTRFGYTAMLGCVLAYLVLVSRSILASIIAHFCFNMSSGVLYLYLLATGEPLPEQKPYEYADPTALPTQFVISAVFILLSWLLLRSFTAQAAQLRPGIVIGRFGLVKTIHENAAFVPPPALPQYPQPYYPAYGAPNGYPQGYGPPPIYPQGYAPPAYDWQSYVPQPQRWSVPPSETPKPRVRWFNWSFGLILGFWLLLGWGEDILVRVDARKTQDAPTVPTTAPKPTTDAPRLVHGV